MYKKWNFKESPDLMKIQQFARKLNIHSALAAVLMQRGVDSLERARHFFRPNLEQLHDPFLMKDMEKAVELIENTIREGHKILIYGDYDVDGTTAVSLVYGFLRQWYHHIEYYLPDRYTEGYGLSEKGLQYAIDNGFKLVITLDCGIKAVELVSKGNEHGLEFVICDHHLPGTELPPAAAILDTKQPGCQYPYKELTGCGVGFKLINALCIRRKIPQQATYEFLDLVAVSIAADIVPITGENRVLSYFGLRKLNMKPRKGLRALLKIGGIKHKVDIPEVVFGLAPRINAAGRIDHARSAVALLLSDDDSEAAQWAENVNHHNELRKEKDKTTANEAIAMIEQAAPGAGASATVLYKKDWHKGVIGIVASRCIEKYYKPTIILTRSMDKATGSARSVPGFDIYQAISECSDLLDAYGGHQYAAGLTMPVEKVSEFQTRFQQVVSTSITKELLTPFLDIDQVVSLDSLTDNFYTILSKMGPFGPGNMTPVFVTEGLEVCSEPRVLKQEHLKFRVASDSGRKFDGIAFGMADYADELAAGSTFDAAYTLEMNSFRGEESLQMMVKDIKFRG